MKLHDSSFNRVIQKMKSKIDSNFIIFLPLRAILGFKGQMMRQWWRNMSVEERSLSITLGISRVAAVRWIFRENQHTLIYVHFSKPLMQEDCNFKKGKTVNYGVVRSRFTKPLWDEKEVGLYYSRTLNICGNEWLNDFLPFNLWSLSDHISEKLYLLNS